MIRKLTALVLCLVLLAGSALADVNRTVLYTYPTVSFTGYLGEMPTHPMRYVNQFFYADGTYTPMGERLLKWLDMSPREDRSGSGYLMLEQQYEHQTSFGQTIGHYVRWLLDRGAETVSSVGLNLVKSAADQALYTTRFGKAGASALPYYEMLRQSYTAYLTNLERRMSDADLGIKLLGDMLSPAYAALADAMKEPELPDRVLVTTNPSGYTQGDEVILHITDVTRNPRLNDLPITTQLTAVEKLPDGSWGETFTFTLDDVAMETLNGHKVILDVEELPKVKREVLRGGVLEDVGEELITATGDFDAGFWYRRLDPLTFDYYKQELLKSQRYQKLHPNDKRVVDNALANREEILKKPDRSPMNRMLDRVGVIVDIASAVESWHSYFTRKEALTLQELNCLQVIAGATQEQLEQLTDWAEAVWADPNLKDKDKERIGGALAALMVEVAATGDEMLNALAENNAQLATFSDKADAFNSTFEAIVSLTGLSKIDPMAASGGLGAAVIGAQVVDLFITLIGGEEYFDAYDRVTSLYDLQASLTGRVLANLNTYALHRSDELARAIINDLNLIREMKLVGEEVVMMYYLSDFCSDLGLNDAPTMFAVLMEEVLNAPSTHELDAKGSCRMIWGAYERQAYVDQSIVGLTYSLAESSTPLANPRLDSYPSVSFTAAGDVASAVALQDKLLGYYRMGEESINYRGIQLAELPGSYADGLSGLPEKYVNFPGEQVPFGKMTLAGNVRYYGIQEEDPAWREGKLPVIDNMNSVFVEPVYLYQKGATTVVFTENEWEAYQTVENQVEQLLQSYNGSDPEDHQNEERLMWGRLTNHYIESFKMYDPNADYPINPMVK